MEKQTCKNCFNFVEDVGLSYCDLTGEPITDDELCEDYFPIQEGETDVERND